MRSEQEMFDLILGYAQNDSRIRAVYMNGSRTNPNAKKDIFQDYDIVYVVADTHPFIDDKSWLGVFGEVAVMQEPDDNVLYGEVNDRNERYAYLMQFEDGNRIDLSILAIRAAKDNFISDSQTLPLLDKDGLLPEIPPPSDKDYLIQRPDAVMYFNCCNEFWWVSPYIAKGLWRKEILFALEHLEKCVRPMLLMMLSWEAGIRTGFSVNAGKSHKYLERYLPPETWTCLLKTYPEAGYQAVWDAVFEAGSLFRKTAGFVARELGFTYNADEDRRTTALLLDIRALPHDAVEIRPDILALPHDATEIHRGGAPCT
jgi:aminoglycoside 6-adenylyltransferase